jgi:hypothetical protein
MSSTPTTKLALIGLLAILAAGCGHTQVVGDSRTLQVGITEYRIVPDSAKVKEGTLTIVVHNYGILTHNLEITQGSQTEGTTIPIWPGGSADLTVALLPGKYQMLSTLLSDQALGIYGTLTVVS